MSNSPSSSPRRAEGSGGHSLGGERDPKPLTAQQLRDQRLARFGGNQKQKPTPPRSPKKSPPKSPPKNQLKPPPTNTTTAATSSSPKNHKIKATEPKIDNTNETASTTQKQPPPVPPSSPVQTKSIQQATTTKKSPSTDQPKSNDNFGSGLDLSAFLEAQAEQDLQTAIALSMGLPAPKPTIDPLDMEPLPALESAGREDPLGLAFLATGIATTPVSTAPSTPMQIEEDESDSEMGVPEEDRKPAFVEAVPKSPEPILRTDPQNFSGRVRTWYKTAEPFRVLDFHDCMWDKGVTTENDQKRWLSQGIQFKDEHNGSGSSPGTKTDKSSLLAAIISGPGVWCLTQQHGGPCGVLASIQAELLVILLFGPRTVHPLSMISIDFPMTLDSEFTTSPPDMSRSKMRQVLALSMGMMLARASLMPSATLQDDTTSSDSDTKSSGSENGASSFPHPEPTVRIVLPKNELWEATGCLEWDHLEPWNIDEGGGGISDQLLVYTISLIKYPSRWEDTASKRQKHNCDVGVDHACQELAHATAQFLLETNSLNWFQRPGGVLLMVMSMAASRGIPTMQGDMDDTTAKLTTSFGHCSQELINLLLTGQAVSNVFDHTLRPSGELVCRGIQSQPAIGYLTQLEAMRYVEVGGFYKTPRFPIWVVGSTSHFTVMFGDGSALKESTSDVLLEKVRRAFKRMEGGAEENGFIQTSQLGDFLKSVDLKISEHEVQMLEALMDKYCAGIILWEDLWKSTSRLLTGASIESIIDGADEKSNGSNNFANATITPVDSSQPADDTQLSDEDLARKLQAEWNGTSTTDTVDIASTNVADSSSIASTISSSTANPSVAPTEKFGHTFQLYHYNGLRGGNFKPFRVTRLSADEAIGASISLGSTNQASHSSAFGGELDSVLRTKWPGCRINWLSGSSPSID